LRKPEGSNRSSQRGQAYTFDFFIGTGAKLRETGDLFGISESGMSQAARRFEEAMKTDSPLEKRILEKAGELALSNAQA